MCVCVSEGVILTSFRNVGASPDVAVAQLAVAVNFCVVANAHILPRKSKKRKQKYNQGTHATVSDK